MRPCRNYAVVPGDVIKVQAFELEVVSMLVEAVAAPACPQPRPLTGCVPLHELAARLTPAFTGASVGRSASDCVASSTGWRTAKDLVAVAHVAVGGEAAMGDA